MFWDSLFEAAHLPLSQGTLSTRGTKIVQIINTRMVITIMSGTLFLILWFKSNDMNT
jgi:hypothetical protein